MQALQPVFPDVAFCPTGGIDATRAREYLQLVNVIAVGGSWVLPSRLLGRGDFATITKLAIDAAKLERVYLAGSQA